MQIVLQGCDYSALNKSINPFWYDIGANYCEANGASSKRGFQNKIFICKKEGKETLYWLELIGKSIDDEKQKEKARKLWQEAKELTLIFSKIAYSTKK